MKRLALAVAALAFAASCNSNNATAVGAANLSGAHDLVIVDQLEPEGNLLAGRGVVDDVEVSTGLPSAFFFVTSTAGNELRAFQNVKLGTGARAVVRAPNPLEPLSIPVLDRPTRIVADEGRNAANTRVTGPYVYATRPGAQEVSVVSVARFRQLTGHPMSTPAPVTDLTAWMDVPPGAPVLATPIPATTRLFVATWDGSVGAIYSAELPTDRELSSLPWQRVVARNAESIVALTVVPPSAARTLDGAPFCVAKGCLVYATRRDGGRAGDTFIVDPETGVTASLGFGGPVRLLTPSEARARVYGVLDEQVCGSPACGGVLAVDLLTGTAGAFPRALNALGAPMEPMRSTGLISGVSVAANSNVRVTSEVISDVGVRTRATTLQFYSEIGAFSSSAGDVTFFSGLAGSVIDFDGLRTSVSEASLRLPGALEDGGLSFTSEDGGVLGTTTAATVVTDGAPEQPWRVSTVDTPQGRWLLDFTDGHFETQALVAVYQGQLPGLVSLPTRLEDGLVLAAGGLETRALVGDSVVFETGGEGPGYQVCGRTTVTSIGAGTLAVADIPAGCEARARYSVRAGTQKPVVLVGELEGYMGRFAPGETATYNRPLVLLPADLTASRPALTLTIPASLGAPEGGVTTFQIGGFLAPFRVTVDPANTAWNTCWSGSVNQVVFGPLSLGQVPFVTSNNAVVTYATTAFVSTPSGNGVVEFRPEVLERIGKLSTADAVSCWR